MGKLLTVNENYQNLKRHFDNFLDSDSNKAVAVKFILVVLFGAGIVVAGAAVPGLIKIASMNKYSKKLSKRQITNAYNRLIADKSLKVVKTDNGMKTISLTEKGRKKMEKMSLDTVIIRKQNKWDGKWRIVIFDIPVIPKRNNKARKSLREKMRDLGFVKIQKSVWIHPFPCEQEIIFIAETFNVLKYIEIFTAEKMLYEIDLLKTFHLNRQ